MEVYDILNEIFNFLDHETLRIIPLVSKDWLNNFKDKVYYKSITFNKQLSNLFYLKEFECNYTDKIFNYIANDKNICIAGGFTTQLFLNNNVSKESDIDIYYLSSKENIFDVHKKFINFLNDNFTIVEITCLSHIININIAEVEHILQLIFTDSSTLTDILMSFDNSHNRCGFYGGLFYNTPDAIYSKQSGKTYFYELDITAPKRYRKAKKLGLEIINEINVEGVYKEIDFEQINFHELLNYYIDIKDWINSYSSPSDIFPTITLMLDEITKYKNRLIVENNILLILEDTLINIDLKIRKKCIIKAKLCGKFINPKTLLLSDKMYAHKMRSIFLYIGSLFNSGRENPIDIRHCKDIQGWDNYLKSCSKYLSTIKPLSKTYKTKLKRYINLVKKRKAINIDIACMYGYEYHDKINIKEQYSIIKFDDDIDNYNDNYNEYLVLCNLKRDKSNSNFHGFNVKITFNSYLGISYTIIN